MGTKALRGRRPQIEPWSLRAQGYCTAGKKLSTYIYIYILVGARWRANIASAQSENAETNISCAPAMDCTVKVSCFAGAGMGDLSDVLCILTTFPVPLAAFMEMSIPCKPNYYRFRNTPTFRQ